MIWEKDIELVTCYLFLPRGKVVWGERKSRPEEWKGLYTGFGGQVEKGESRIKAVKREVEEECKVELREEDIEKVGEIEIFFPKRRHMLHIYRAVTYSVGSETEEMIPRPLPKEMIPWNRLVPGDENWILSVYSRKTFKAVMERADLLTVVSFDIQFGVSLTD